MALAASKWNGVVEKIMENIKNVPLRCAQDELIGETCNPLVDQ